MNMIEKLLEKVDELNRRDEANTKYIYTDYEIIEFLIGIFEGKEGEVQEIEKKGERHYRIKLEEEWFYLYHGLVAGTDFSIGKLVALYREKGETFNSGRLASLIRRNMYEGEVEVIFNSLKKIFDSNITRSTKNSHDISSEIVTALNSFNYLSKISDNIFTIKKDNKSYTLVRSECYKHDTLTHKFEIHNGDDKIKEFDASSSVVNSLFKYLDFITEASAIELTEVKELLEIIIDLES